MARTFSTISTSSGPTLTSVFLTYANDGEPGSAPVRATGADASAVIAALHACAPFMAIMNALVDAAESRATDPPSRAELVASADAAEQRKIAALAAEQAAIVRRQAAERATEAAQIALAGTTAAIARATATLDLATAARVAGPGGAPGRVVPVR